MTQQTINVGALPNDGEGDPLRVAFQKVNNNFASLYATSSNTQESVTIGLDPNQSILEYPAAEFTQGMIQIRSSDPTTSDMQHIVLSASITNDQADVKFSGYGTAFEGSALCSYNMIVESGFVKVLANPVIDTTIHHFLTYQITNVSQTDGPALALDGYASGTVMGTEAGTIIVTDV